MIGCSVGHDDTGTKAVVGTLKSRVSQETAGLLLTHYSCAVMLQHASVHNVLVDQVTILLARNMKGTLMKFNNEVVPLSEEGVTDADIYRDYLRTLHSQAVTDARANFVPNRVLGASPPDISPLENLLPRSVHTTLAQLHSGQCRLLNSYKARITSGISDVCPECGVAPHCDAVHCGTQGWRRRLTVPPSCF